MPERFHGYLIPDGVKPSEQVAGFMRLREGLREHPGYTDWRAIASCDTCKCIGIIRCSECLLWLDELVTWRGIARFHAYEQWLREAGVLPEGYAQFPITGPEGIIIGSNFLDSDFLNDDLRAWDSRGSAYCAGAACVPGGCDKCICCCNHGDRQQKLEAFYQYASALGLSLRDRCAEGEECGVADVTTVPKTEESVAPVANPQATQPIPENSPQLSSWTKALAKYNRGFACWCDALDKTMQCPECGCAGCLCSTANPEAEAAFGRWAKENGWEVTRAEILDTYKEPEIKPPPREVDFSMSTTSFDDPYRLPELKPWMLVHFDIPLAFGDGRTETQWGVVVGRNAGCTYWVMLLAAGAAEGSYDRATKGVLGYTWEVSIDGADSFCTSQVHASHIDAVIDLQYADGAFQFINGSSLASVANATSTREVFANARNRWFRAEN